MYDFLAQEKTLCRDWDIFGLNLGLLDNTLRSIKESCKEDDAKLKECLSCWLKRCDIVHDTGGTTLESLKKALKFLGKSEIAEKAVAEFSLERGQFFFPINY